MIYHDKKGGENPWRKHHTSSIARDIWIYDSKAGTHKKITSRLRVRTERLYSPITIKLFIISVKKVVHSMYIK
jgi:tricorn protease-like protein